MTVGAAATQGLRETGRAMAPCQADMFHLKWGLSETNHQARRLAWNWLIIPFS